MFDMIEFREQAAKLADVDPSLVSDDELLTEVIDIEAVRSLLDVAESHRLAELEQRGVCDARFGHTTKAWLANTAGISHRVAGSRLRTARRLHHLPAMDAAVTAGEVSFEHLSSLVASAGPRVLPRLEAVDDDVTALARQVGFEEWRGEVHRLVELLDDGSEPDETTNRLRFAETLDGVTHLDGTMTRDVAAVIRSAVEARADELYRQRVRDRERTGELEVPPRDNLRMLALADLITATTTRRAEVTLVLHDGQLTEPDGGPLPQAAAGVYGCDPDLWAVLVDHMGIPLDVGHARRFATVTQRRAIEQRDGGCGFPGCDQPMRRCDVHHLTSPLSGGRTAVEAMVALCRRHHTVTHRPGWKLAANPDGSFTWTTPAGQTLTNRPRRHHRPTPTGRPPPEPDG
jgi:hypothetical protein